MASITGRIMHALNLDAKTGGPPPDSEDTSGGVTSGTTSTDATSGAVAPSVTASPVGPGTSQTSDSGTAHLHEGGVNSTTTSTGTTSNTGTTAPSVTASPIGLGTSQTSDRGTAHLHEGGVSAADGKTAHLHEGGVASRNTTSSSNTTGGSRTIASTGIPATTSATANLPSRSTLTSSDEHWDKAAAATEEARRQALLVEEGARSHREASEEYYKSEREVTQARHTVEEIETRIRNLGLEAKQTRLKTSRGAYEAEMARLSGLYSSADAARSKADAVQDDVNAKGHELEAQVQESKLYSDRLAALEAELLEARATEQQSRQRHQEHLGQLEPLRNKHRHHKAERARLAGALAKLQAELDEVRGREGVAARKLDGYRAEHEGLAAELADLEAHLQRKEQEKAARRGELDGLSGQREHLLGLLGQKRATVLELTKETQETMARAQAQSNAADAQAANLQQTKERLAASERSVDASRTALTSAVAESRQLEGAKRSTASDVESYAQQASAMEAELRAAKDKVDLAQAKKEELWELAKVEGGAGDQTSDTHYVKNVAEPHGEDPSKMVTKSDLTENLAGKIEYGADKVLHHQRDGTVQNPPRV